MTQKKIHPVILITGAASGIGQASAYEAAAQGAKLVLADISETGEEVRDKIIQQGGEAIFIKADVSKSEDHQSILDITLKTYGTLDAACNNAGIEQAPCPLIDLEESTWERIMEVNLKSVWLALKYQIPVMLRQGRGSIVNTASVAALKGVPEISAYNTSKAGVVMLSRTAALEYAAHGIRINCVCPGLVMTLMAERMAQDHPNYFQDKLLKPIPMQRGATPTEIAKTLLFLCSDNASFITGQCLTADGGWLA